MLTIFAIIITVAVTTVIGTIAVNSVAKNSSEQMLLLLCKTGERNLDSYFESVEQSVEIVSHVVQVDLSNNALDQDHMERARDIFAKTANKTNGVLTYYYRIDPSASEEVVGFWYVYNQEKRDFVEHDVTPINEYDTSDTSALVWFTVPKTTGKATWLPSYVTENLIIDGHEVRVVSYNVPIYQNGKFVGVVGIEIDYKTMAEQVDNIKLYDNGYAFVNDNKGKVIYHPLVDVLKLSDENKLSVPDGLLDKEEFIFYEYNGVKKMGVWLPLSNGMRLNVAVPVSEINAIWQKLILEIVLVAAVVLTIFIIITVLSARHLTRPLLKLTDAAEQINKGNYEVKMEYNENNEIGMLTKTFNKLIAHLKNYISDLNGLAYSDALTSVRNKGAFDIYLKRLQDKMDKKDGLTEFAIAILDCDNLKGMNDNHGHEKGDIYLKNAANLICRVFQSSPVFRIGGDEFAIVLQNDDYRNREELKCRFEEESAEICTYSENPWDKVSVAIGIAEYDPKNDVKIESIIKRADRLMYGDKYLRKKN